MRLCVCDWVSRMPTCSHTDTHMHWVLMSLLVGSYHTFSVNLLSVPAACGLEIPGHVAKRQVPILFFLVTMVRGRRVGPEWNRYRLSLRRHHLSCALHRCTHTNTMWVNITTGKYFYIHFLAMFHCCVKRGK